MGDAVPPVKDHATDSNGENFRYAVNAILGIAGLIIVCATVCTVTWIIAR